MPCPLPPLPFPSPLPGASYHLHPTPQSLKCLWASRTQFMYPIPQSVPGTLASWSTCVGTCTLYTRPLALATLGDVRMLAWMPNFSQVMCFQCRSPQYKLSSTELFFTGRQIFSLFPAVVASDNKPSYGRYWALGQATQELKARRASRKAVN